jgi:hypothetical protein
MTVAVHDENAVIMPTNGAVFMCVAAYSTNLLTAFSACAPGTLCIADLAL